MRHAAVLDRYHPASDRCATSRGTAREKHGRPTATALRTPPLLSGAPDGMFTSYSRDFPQYSPRSAAVSERATIPQPRGESWQPALTARGAQAAHAPPCATARAPAAPWFDGRTTHTEAFRPPNVMPPRRVRLPDSGNTLPTGAFDGVSTARSSHLAYSEEAQRQLASLPAAGTSSSPRGRVDWQAAPAATSPRWTRADVLKSSVALSGSAAPGSVRSMQQETYQWWVGDHRARAVHRSMATTLHLLS